MKRKLLNAALFGAVLVAAPVSTFVSCADYDADFQTMNDRLDGEVKDLTDLINKKEAAINDQIKTLDAQVKAVEEAYKKADADLKAQLEKAIKDGDAALQAQIEDCQTKCKAEFAAVRAELAAAKKELQDALAAAEKQHSEDVAKLLNADKDLQNGIDKAVADIAKANEEIENLKKDLKTVNTQIGEINTLIGDINTKLQKVNEDIDGVKTQITTVENTLKGQITVINGEIEKLQKDLAATKADLQGQITKNATDIATNKANLEKHVADFESHKTWAQGEFDKVTAELAKKATKEEVKQLEDALRALIQANANEISGLKGRMNTAEENISKLQTAVAGLSADVAKNTQAIVDNAARILDLEGKIAENATKLAALREEFEAYQVAQAAVDAAQDLALTNAVAELNTKINGVDSKLDTEIANRKAAVEKCYNDAVAKATELANLAEANAKAYTDLLANDLHTNYYTKTQIDALLKVINDDLDGIHEDLSLFHDDFNNFSLQTKAALADIKTTLGEHDERITANADRIEEVREELLDVTDDLYRECNAIRDLITLRVSELNERIDGVEEAYKAADVALGERIDDLATALNNFKTQVAQWNKEISSEVKGFVLEPASYYEGIQAIEGTSYEYTKWNVSDALNPVQDGDYIQYCPAVTAHYHINPSAAVLSTEVSNYSYAVLDRTNRGVNTQLKPVVTAVAQNGGMLDVTLKLTDASANKTPQTHMDPSEVTVMALQYTNPAAKAENQVVTSDYAVLYLNPLKEVSLVSATDSDHEITDEYAQVVPNNDQDWVEYTSSYDIQEHIAAKFGGENSVSMTNLPEGFTVKYTAVAGDVTYFTAITADGKITPQLPNGKPATTACVGKNATWRIDIMHGDDVVEVGFYKVTITGEAVIETAPTVVTEDILKITCEPTDEALNTNLSIENVWNKIVEVTGEELAVVKGKYSVTTADGKVVQYKEYESEADRVLYKLYEGKGVIKLNADGTVNWTVLDNDPYVESDLRSATKDVKSMVTYIRVRSNEAISKDTYNEFYMPLTWTPKPIEVWGDFQELSWTYTRVANQWQQSTNVAEEKELRLYADLTKTGATPFTYDIPTKAMVDFDLSDESINKNLTWAGTAAEFINVKNDNIELEKGHFRFIEHPNTAARKTTVGGVEYKFTVSADGKNFLANNVVIATITEQGVVNLENNATSQKLLNAFEKDDLAYGHTLCARVGFAAECCAGEVKVIDGDFDVRFIKPLTVKAADINISDADDILNAGKITTSILSNIVAFNNYTLADRPNYIEVFGVGIELGEPKDWKTNYNAAADDFSKTLGQNHIDDLFSANEAKGEITYTNNTAVVSEFSVIVPVTLHYNWNTTPVSVNIKLNVGRTQGNSHRR